MTKRYAHIGATQVQDAVNCLDKILSKPESIPGDRVRVGKSRLTLLN
jgi:hypothetical protein